MENEMSRFAPVSHFSQGYSTSEQEAWLSVGKKLGKKCRKSFTGVRALRISVGRWGKNVIFRRSFSNLWFFKKALVSAYKID